jgi:hypothetical protein
MGKKTKKQSEVRRADDQELVLGRPARDLVSGFTGRLVAEYRYLNGCRRFEIGGVDDNGKPPGYVFDESQVEVLAGSPLVLVAAGDTHALVEGDVLPPEPEPEEGVVEARWVYEPDVVDEPKMAAAHALPVDELIGARGDGTVARRFRRTGGDQSSSPVVR